MVAMAKPTVSDIDYAEAERRLKVETPEDRRRGIVSSPRPP